MFEATDEKDLDRSDRVGTYLWTGSRERTAVGHLTSTFMYKNWRDASTVLNLWKLIGVEKVHVMIEQISNCVS